MSEKFYIEIDASSWLEATGVDTTVFIGDACVPCYTNTESYEELIEKELQSHTVRGKLTEGSIEKVEQFVSTLEAAATYAYERFQELKSE